MELKLINDQGESIYVVSASDAAFARPYNESLVHQVITAYLATRASARASRRRAAR